jgi:hypothetical protein
MRAQYELFCDLAIAETAREADEDLTLTTGRRDRFRLARMCGGGCTGERELAIERTTKKRATSRVNGTDHDRRYCKPRNSIHCPADNGHARTRWESTIARSYRLLQLALIVFGAVMLLLYPLAVVWPSGWAWHSGAPYQSDYFMMIVGVYVTLGAFLINAARNPEANLSLIWFAVWSSVVHAAIMAVQSFDSGHAMGHLVGDVPGLLLVAIVLAVLVLSSGLKQPPTDRVRMVTKKDVADQA